MSTFRIKGGICTKLQRISPASVISLKLIKSFSFKGKMENKSEELLPHWQVLRNISYLLNVKGIILTNPKELLLKHYKLTVLWGYSDILDLRERLLQTLKELLPSLAISWKLLKSFSCKGEIVTNPKELLSKWPVLRGFSNLLDLRQRLWQTPKNCSQNYHFSGVSPIF